MNVKKFIVITASVIMCITYFFIFRTSSLIERYNSGFGTFDMNFYYSPSTFYDVLTVMKPEGFKLYKNIIMIDYVYMTTLFIVTVSLYTYLINMTQKKYRSWMKITAAAVLIFDFIEDRAVESGLNAFPQHIKGTAELASFATKAKFISLYIEAFFIIILIISCIRLRVNKE